MDFLKNLETTYPWLVKNIKPMIFKELKEFICLLFKRSLIFNTLNESGDVSYPNGNMFSYEEPWYIWW